MRIPVTVEQVNLHATGAERVAYFNDTVDQMSPIGMLLCGSCYRVVTYTTTGTSTIYERRVS